MPRPSTCSTRPCCSRVATSRNAVLLWTSRARCDLGDAGLAGAGQDLQDPQGPVDRLHAAGGLRGRVAHGATVDLLTQPRQRPAVDGMIRSDGALERARATTMEGARPMQARYASQCAACAKRIEPGGRDRCARPTGRRGCTLRCASGSGARRRSAEAAGDEGRRRSAPPTRCRPAPPRCSPTARAAATPVRAAGRGRCPDGPQGSVTTRRRPTSGWRSGRPTRRSVRSRDAGGGQRLDVRRELLQELLVDRLARPRLGELRQEAGGQPRPVGAADRPGRGARRRHLPLGQGPLRPPDERPGRPARRGGQPPASERCVTGP